MRPWVESGTAHKPGRHKWRPYRDSRRKRAPGSNRIPRINQGAINGAPAETITGGALMRPQVESGTAHKTGAINGAPTNSGDAPGDPGGVPDVLWAVNFHVRKTLLMQIERLQFAHHATIAIEQPGPVLIQLAKLRAELIERQ